MFIFGDILKALYRTFNAETNDAKDEILRECQKAYYELCGATSWEFLRGQVDYAYDESVDGMWMPADMIGIDCITDGETLWKKTNMSASLNKNALNKQWFMSGINQTPLLAGRGIQISAGDTAFTGATGITAAMTGEYIRIAGQPAVYKLASATTLETPYYGPKQMAATFEVRPVGTKKIKLLSEYGETDKSTPTVYIWSYPAQLYGAEQLVVLPSSALLEIAVRVKMYSLLREDEMKNSAYKDLYGAKGRYEGELTRTIAANPDFIPPVRPESSSGKPAGWGARR
jgi:hypothetical protein